MKRRYELAEVLFQAFYHGPSGVYLPHIRFLTVWLMKTVYIIEPSVTQSCRQPSLCLLIIGLKGEKARSCLEVLDGGHTVVGELCFESIRLLILSKLTCERTYGRV